MAKSTARLSGTVEVRPIRLALVIPPHDSWAFARAVSAATCCWGGASYPIITSDREPEEVQHIVRKLGIDAVVALGDDEQSGALASMDSSRWLGYGHPFKEATFERPLGIGAIVDILKRAPKQGAPIYLTWNEDDPQADIWTVLYGCITEMGAFERETKELLTEAMPRHELSSEAIRRWPDGLLALGMEGVHFTSGPFRGGVAVVEPSSLEDRIRFWNLRATGHSVLPWPEPYEPRIASIARAFIPQVLKADKDRASGFFDIYVSNPDADVPSDLSAIIEASELGVHIVRSDIDPLDDTPGLSGIGTSYAQSFDVAAIRDENGQLEARVPLPPVAAFRPPGRSDFGLQRVAARIEYYSERGVPERTSFAIPAVRELANDFRWGLAPTAPIARGIGDGVVLGVHFDGHDVAVRSLSSVYLIDRLLTRAGFEVRVGDAGSWTARAIDMLGGVASTLASHPAVRNVLDRAARSGGATANQLLDIAKKHGGNWIGSLGPWSFGDTHAYAQWVVGVLANERVLQSYLSYRCRTCGLKQHLRAEEVNDTLTCPDCEATSSLGLEVLLGAKWVFRTRRLLDRDILHAVFPIASALHLLDELTRDSMNLPYALGLELTSGEGKSFEIDFAALTHEVDLGPVLIVGEAKARHDFDSDDLRNLETVQDAVRGVGIECIIAIASSKDTLSADEALMIRQSADRFLLPVGGASRSVWLNVPLVLTRSSLTQPRLSAGHPTSGLKSWPRLPELATSLLAREAGFDRVDWTTRRIQWSDTSSAEPSDESGSSSVGA